MGCVLLHRTTVCLILYMPMQSRYIVNAWLGNLGHEPSDRRCVPSWQNDHQSFDHTQQIISFLRNFHNHNDLQTLLKGSFCNTTHWRHLQTSSLSFRNHCVYGTPRMKLKKHSMLAFYPCFRQRVHDIVHPANIRQLVPIYTSSWKSVTLWRFSFS